MNIDSIRLIEDNWDGHNAPKPNSYSIRRTRYILVRLKQMKLEHKYLLPTVEGGIGLIFRNGTKFVSLEVLNSNELLYIFENDNDEVRENNIGLKPATNKNIDTLLNKIQNFLNPKEEK